jgi:hypothetical protein
MLGTPSRRALDNQYVANRAKNAVSLVPLPLLATGQRGYNAAPSTQDSVTTDKGGEVGRPVGAKPSPVHCQADPARRPLVDPAGPLRTHRQPACISGSPRRPQHHRRCFGLGRLHTRRREHAHPHAPNGAVHEPLRHHLVGCRNVDGQFR